MAATNRLIPLVCILFSVWVIPGQADTQPTSHPGIHQLLLNHAELKKLDDKLARAHHALATLQPEQKQALHEAQLTWLDQRNACIGREHPVYCMRSVYEKRLSTLQSKIHQLQAYVPDAVDRQALHKLRQLVRQSRKNHLHTPLETTIASLAISKDKTTAFGNNQYGAFPASRPKGVSRAEWQALLSTDINAGGENHGFLSSYTLVDLDGDGLRDLIVDTYSGGTGLWDEISTLRRTGNTFDGICGPCAHYGGDKPLYRTQQDKYLYALNGRGSNQQATWIRLNGRVYAAYRDSAYGVDRLYLLRPFTVVGQVPVLTIHYRYNFSVPRKQPIPHHRDTKIIDQSLQQALTDALVAIPRDSIQTTHNNHEGPPPCPIPDNIPAQEKEYYRYFGAGYYAYEIITDTYVWHDGSCYLARVTTEFGRYDPKHGGLDSSITLRSPGPTIEDATRYLLNATRTVISIKTSFANFKNR